MTTFNYNDIPADLQACPHWVLWARYPDPKKDDPAHMGKVPINAHNLRFAMTNKPETWAGFAEALDAYSKHCGETIDAKGKPAEISGIGFVLQGSGFVGIDIDDKPAELADFLEGTLTGITGDIMSRTAGTCYAEISQSGKGAHIFARGTLPGKDKKSKENGLEMYQDRRFLAMTGNTIPTHNNITDDISDELREIYEKYFPEKAKAPAPVSAPAAMDPVLDITIDRAIKTARRTNGKFSGLYDGTFQGLYPSFSEARGALLMILAYYLQGDAEKIEQAYRASGLFAQDRKFDSRRGDTTLGKYDIATAIKKNGGRYFDYDRKRNDALYSLAVSQSEPTGGAVKEPADAAELSEPLVAVEIAETHYPTVYGLIKSNILKDHQAPYVLKSDGIHYKANDYNIRKHLIETGIAADFYIDLFSEKLMIHDKNGDRAANDDDILQYKIQIQRVTFRDSDISRDKMYEAIRAVCPQIHPVKDYFNSLHWDGTPRAERLLIDLLGAPDDVYVREATKIFLLGIISRVFNPGTKFDYMIVLQGKQALGKSAFFKAMSIRSEWFGEIGAAHIKDRKILGEDAAGKLILEYCELDGIRQTTAERLKATLTSTSDNFRAAYERISKDRPRKYVIGGTTNSSTYLSDPTGNRRFLPIPITKKGFLTPDEVNQVWAEAYTIYRAGGFKLYLSSDIEEIAETYRANVTQLTSDDFIEDIQNYVDSSITPAGTLIQRITPTDIYTGLSKQNEIFHNMSRPEAISIIKQALERLGWKYTSKRVGGSAFPIKSYWRP